MSLRSPAEILDVVAARQQYVTPLQEYMPISPSMARSCVREAYADAVRLLASAGTDPVKLKTARDQLTTMATREN